MTHATTIDRGEQRRKNAELARAGIRQHFKGEGAVRRCWRFAYDSLANGVLVAAAIVGFACAAFGVGISTGFGHEETLAELHVWMQETPLDQVRAAVQALTVNVLRLAAVCALLLGPLIAFVRTVLINRPATTA